MSSSTASRLARFGLMLALAATFTSAARARPNTHAPAISTWDSRASSIVLGLGGAVSGEGSFSFKSYNANFSSTSGVLSAQFGVHYVTFEDGPGAPLARGVSAGGVALISLPLAARYQNGVAGASFAFYVGGVPTAMFSGQLNYISVPLVLGVGLPYSPAPYLTFRPWVELSPGLNFDTNIQPVVTNEAIQSAMDGTLTRAEVEDLVREGLQIDRATTVGKRAGLSLAAHLGERVDIDANWMLGAGHAGAMSLGAALVIRWDALVPGVTEGRDRGEAVDEDCAALAARYHRRCPLRRRANAADGASRTPRAGAGRAATRAAPARGRAAPARGRGARRPAASGRRSTRAPSPVPAARPADTPRTAPAAAPGTAPPAGTSERPAARKKARPRTTPGPAPVPSAPPSTDALPPLQAAPPRSP